jgi:hypothetical protein
MQARLDEAESMGSKGGKRALSKLEARVHELEQELDQVKNLSKFFKLRLF